MKTARAPLQFMSHGAASVGALLLLLWLAAGVAAQSTDIEFPTPIRTNEVSGTITPRDVGDPRLTRYFFSLSGTPGDLVLTVESQNLNGDVDLFTAGSLRPLAKLSMYAGDTTSSTSKSIYFKRQESLILRIEARSPNDNAGNFRIRFEGAFAPFVGEAREPEPIGPGIAETSPTGKKTRRVTATGARIDEPVVKTVEKTPEPSETPAPEVAAAEKTPAPPDKTETSVADTEPATRTATKTPRPRRPRPTPRATPRRGRRQPAPTPAESQPPAPTEQPEAQPAQPTPPEPAALGPRLIIETKDGLRVERYMTSVRRVTVDNGQVVVVLKNGKTERQPMTNVLKMSIEP